MSFANNPQDSLLIREHVGAHSVDKECALSSTADTGSKLMAQYLINDKTTITNSILTLKNTLELNISSNNEYYR